MVLRSYGAGLATKHPAYEPEIRTHQGGLAVQVNVFDQLRRALILGAEGDTYYAKQQDHAKRNLDVVERALNTDPDRTIQEIVNVSDGGLAPKNDFAIVALAMAASYKNPNIEFQTRVRTKALSKDVLPKVARTGSHILDFVSAVQELRGWGVGLRKGIAGWYLSKDAKSVAFQVTKYADRNGMSHRDVLRLAHIKPTDADYNAVFHYITQGELLFDPKGGGFITPEEEALHYLAAVTYVKQEGTPKSEVINAIRRFNLPREVLPTQLLNDNDVWDALLRGGKGMPLTAMIRNLATMTKNGLLTTHSDATKFVIETLSDYDKIRKARVHPIQILSALSTYRLGHGVRSDARWTPVTRIIDALDQAFYGSFQFVAPTNKEIVLGLDTSSSMMGGEVAGIPGLTPRQASAAMALVTANVEPNHEFVGYTTSVRPMTISPRQRLDDVMSYIARFPNGGTDTSLPVKYARSLSHKVDAIVSYTDAETGSYMGYSPRYTPTPTVNSELVAYREQKNPEARFIEVIMVANELSGAYAKDPRSLRVVGFDASAPAIMSGFISGNL